MRQVDKYAPLILAAFVVGACATTRHPVLYPDNDAARAGGPLHAVIVGHGKLAGAAALTLPDGEVLTGRYSITAGRALGAATVSGPASGSGGHGSGGAVQSAIVVSGTGGGVADMIGPKGTKAHCQFVNDNVTGHGDGMCRLSTGAVYRMQY